MLILAKLIVGFHILLVYYSSIITTRARFTFKQESLVFVEQWFQFT